jgi:hypothetical protein
VLTEQSSRRGRAEEPPPPPAPRVNSRSSRNGVALQDTKHGQWKRYTDSPGVGSPPPPAPAPSSPTSSRRERRSSPHGGKEKGSSKVRGVPQSFGYVKRSSSATNGTNGTPNGTAPQVQGQLVSLLIFGETTFVPLQFSKVSRERRRPFLQCLGPR